MARRGCGQPNGRGVVSGQMNTVTCYLTPSVTGLCKSNYMLLLFIVADFYLLIKKRKIRVFLLMLKYFFWSLVLSWAWYACILGPFVVSAAPLNRSASPPPLARPQSSAAKTLQDPPERQQARTHSLWLSPPFDYRQLTVLIISWLVQRSAFTPLAGMTSV